MGPAVRLSEGKQREVRRARRLTHPLRTRHVRCVGGGYQLTREELELPADRNLALIRTQKFGFWVGTKLLPRRAVRWDPARLEDGRVSRRGRAWVEVLPHGSARTPERFHAADVEFVGPSEWLTYYPAADEPVCGWGRPRLPDGGMQYCPRSREEDQPWCRRHMVELESSQGEEKHARNEASDTE